MAEEALVSWVPHWAAGTIEGVHTVRDPLDPEQKITMTCLLCGGVAKHTCTTGNPRAWITRFAVVHRQEHPW